MQQGSNMGEELLKFRGQQVPIKTKTGGRHLDFIWDVSATAVVLCTNADGSGLKTVLSLDAIESFTTGQGGGGATGPAKYK